MFSSAWKWLLQALDDNLLINIATKLQVQIPGFRGRNWNRSIKLLRPRIIQSMLAPQQLMLLSDAADGEVQATPDLLAIRDLTEQQLLEQVPDQLAPTQVLLALLSSPEPSLVERGALLYQQWDDSGLLAEWLHQEPTAGAETDLRDGQEQELDSYKQQLTELEAQLQRRDKKARKLAAELAKQKASVTRARRRWQQERRQLVKQLAEREATLKQLEQQLAAQAETLLEQTQLISQLRESVPSIDAKGYGGATKVRQEPTTRGQAKPKVAVVGNLQQINLPAEHNADYRLLHIAPAELQNEQVLASLQTVDQVWLLTYATPLPLQRRLRQLVPAQILSCLNTYQDYMHNLGQGV